MSRLVDPTLCPDCRATLDASATCRACGLRLTGSLAADLWRLMTDADRIVEQLRSLSGPAPVAATPTPARVPTTAALPSFPARAPSPAPRSRMVPAASVPVVLLSLGALCLLVAAVVFVAVTWSLLGLTGRTLVLLGITSVLAVVAVVLTRKDLRGAAETFWLVVAGMLVVDLLGAQSAGLAGLDALDWRGTAALVGVSLAALGLGVGAWARGQVVGRLYGAEAVAVAGILLVCATNVWGAENIAVACTIAVPVLAGLSVLLRRELPVAAYGVGGLAVATWVGLLLVGWDRALEEVGFTAWWSDFRGWPLLAAALLAAVVVHLPKVPAQVRPIAAGAALLSLVLLATGPATPEAGTRQLVAASAVLLALGVLAAFAPRAWALGATVLAGLGVIGSTLLLVAGPLDALSHVSPDGSYAAGHTLADPGLSAAAWTTGLLAAVVGAALVLLLRRVPAQHQVLATMLVTAAAPAVLALGALDVVLLLEPAIWTAVLASAVATAIAAGAAWWIRDDALAGWVGSIATGYLAAVTLYLAAANDLLIAVTASAFALVLSIAFALRERAGAHVSAAVAGGLAIALGGWALVSWGVQLEADEAARAIALAVYAGVAGVLAAPVTRSAITRITFEGTALLLGALSTTYAPDDRVSAMALTIVGSAVCLVAVANRDRVAAGWLGALLLGVATVLRVTLDVRFPELYTLPAAALLIAVGAWRLRTDREANSFVVLGSGLTLALLPSLLLALEEPVSLRGMLIGAAGVLTLGAGVQQRLSAPFVLGALTTGVLAIRHLEPYADAVPRWISLGGVGVVLLVVGVTWEARRRNLETAGRYLAALR